MKKIILLIVLAFSLSINAQSKDSTEVDSFQKTDEVLAEVVKKAIVIAEKTGEFAIEQAPLLLQEFYMWHIWSTIFYVFIGLILFLLGRYMPYLWLSKEPTSDYNIKFFSRYNNQSSYYGEPSASWVVFSITIPLSLLIIVCNLHSLIYILVAPKLYLIDYFIK